MEQEQGETYMVDLKDTELTPMTKAEYRAWEDYVIKYNEEDRKSTRLNSSHSQQSRMPSSA